MMRQLTLEVQCSARWASIQYTPFVWPTALNIDTEETKLRLVPLVDQRALAPLVHLHLTNLYINHLRYCTQITERLIFNFNSLTLPFVTLFVWKDYFCVNRNATVDPSPPPRALRNLCKIHKMAITSIQIL